MHNKTGSALNAQLPDFVKWLLISLGIWVVLSYLYGCVSALRILHPAVALFELTPLYAIEILVSSIGLTYILNRIAVKRRKKPNEMSRVIAALLSFAAFFFAAFVLECTLFQYHHYGNIGADRVISTRDTDDGWTTLRFGKFSLGENTFLTENFFFSLADIVDGTKDDEARIDFLKRTLTMPGNSRDEEYQAAVSEYERRIEENGFDGAYPTIVSFDDEFAVITFPNLDAEISSIHITPFFLPENNLFTGKKTQSMEVLAVYSDEDNTNRKTKVFTISEGQEYTEYIPLYPVGKVSELNICFINRGAAFREIRLNETIPLTPVLLRMLLVAGVLFAIWLLRRHVLFAVRFDPNSRRQNLGFGLMLLLLLGYCAFMAFTAIEFDYEPGSAGQYNHYLIDALMDGRVDLDLPTSEEYAALDRPYDRGQFELYGIDYLGDKVHWDTVFYNGKWYSYFGIVPAVLMFLPFTAITGQYLPYAVACLIMGYLAILFLLLIWRRFFKRNLSDAAYATYLLSSLALAMCSFVPFLQHRSFFYETVNLGGLMFCAAGMLLLLQYQDTQKKQWLAAACLCFALAVGCRPVLLFSSVLVPLFLWEEIKQRWTGNKGSFVSWCLVIAVPYIAVAIPLMWYNYARFGSVFDFGSTYQVTGLNLDVQNLMNPVGKLQRFLTGIKGYFLNPPLLLLRFPFAQVQSVPVTNSAYIPQYLGAVGLLCIPLSWLLLYSIKAGRRIRREKPRIVRFIIASLAIAVLTAGLSATYCIQPRYEIDYAWLIVLSALFCLYYAYTLRKAQGVSIKRIDHCVSVVCLVSIVLFFFLSFRGEIDPDTAIRPVAVEAYLKRAFTLLGGV